MYIFKHTNQSKQELKYIEIEDVQKTTYAKIYLNLGGSLQELTLNGQAIIKDLSPLTYNNTYASSILFPFANRIKDGKYKFKDNDYQLDINEKKCNNAIHGLVYNKNFEVIDEKATENYASVKLAYHEKSASNGFPFTYSIYLEYVLTHNTIDLNVEIKNTDIKTFPFTLGWHPYFVSNDLYNSSFVFYSNLKFKKDNCNITDGIMRNNDTYGFEIRKQSLDDCFLMEDTEVFFVTPNYNISLTTSEADCFLQLYTPPHSNAIAIEPTTGVSNSFNNGIGLKTLKPDDMYNISWKIEIEDNRHN